MRYPPEKIAVLIDGPALSAMGYILGMKIDYRKLKYHFARSAKLTSINYYAILNSERVENPHVKLLDWLAYNGYRVHVKNTRSFEDEDGGRSVKGTVVVDLSIDLLLMVRHVDHIVLVGGNGEYTYPVLEAKRLGARVTLLSSLKTDAMRPSDDLRRMADDFLDLYDRYDEIAVPQTETNVSE